MTVSVECTTHLTYEKIVLLYVKRMTLWPPFTEFVATGSTARPSHRICIVAMDTEEAAAGSSGDKFMSTTDNALGGRGRGATIARVRSRIPAAGNSVVP